MKEDRRLQRAAALCACILVALAASPTANVDQRDQTNSQKDALRDAKHIAAIAKDCAQRMRAIAQIVDIRAEQLLREDSIRDSSSLAVLYEQVCIKQDLLRNEETALEMSKRRLVILWSDEYEGRVLSDKDVHSRYHGYCIIGSATNSATPTQPQDIEPSGVRSR